MFACEDGIQTPITLPTFNAFMVSVPVVSPLPFWERPANVPVALMEEFATAVVANMDAAALQALATALQPYL